MGVDEVQRKFNEWQESRRNPDGLLSIEIDRGMPLEHRLHLKKCRAYQRLGHTWFGVRSYSFCVRTPTMPRSDELDLSPRIHEVDPDMEYMFREEKEANEWIRQGAPKTPHENDQHSRERLRWTVYPEIPLTKEEALLKEAIPRTTEEALSSLPGDKCVAFAKALSRVCKVLQHLTWSEVKAIPADMEDQGEEQQPMPAHDVKYTDKWQVKIVEWTEHWRKDDLSREPALMQHDAEYGHWTIKEKFDSTHTRKIERERDPRVLPTMEKHMNKKSLSNLVAEFAGPDDNMYTVPRSVEFANHLCKHEWANEESK